MVEGESGILAVSRPEFMPRYEPSKRRVTWPNGAIATIFTAEKPDQLRGPQFDTGWLDEAGSYEDPAVISNFKLGLRLGRRYGVKPQAALTTTPRPTKILKELLKAKSTVVTRGTTYDNKIHLAEEFIAEIEAVYEGTRLGRQELHAELLEVLEGAWFLLFDPKWHVTEEAEFDWHLPVHCPIDAGTSRHTGAVFFQHQELDNNRCRINVFGDYYAKDLYSLVNAEAIRDTVHGLTITNYHPMGRCDVVRLDPAAGAKSGVGPAAKSEYEKVFGAHRTGYWPRHRVHDGLDMLELMLGTPPTDDSPGRQTEILIHPRCKHLIAAFNGYDRKQLKGGEFDTEPRDPNHPHEDLMDALRGGIRNIYPSGRKIEPKLPTRPIKMVF